VIVYAQEQAQNVSWPAEFELIVIVQRSFGKEYPISSYFPVCVLKETGSMLKQSDQL
jgi:hypothetical protein